MIGVSEILLLTRMGLLFILKRLRHGGEAGGGREWRVGSKKGGMKEEVDWGSEWGVGKG